MAEESTRVLVVDDERFFREAICDALRDASIDCMIAEREEDVFKEECEIQRQNEKTSMIYIWKKNPRKNPRNLLCVFLYI